MNHSSHPGWESRGRRPGFDSGFSGGPGFGPEAFDFPFRSTHRRRSQAGSVS